MLDFSQNQDTLVGKVANIQRFSTHDGPGVRTTVFLMGCPLRCYWCQNPETQDMKPVISFRKDKCTVCGKCVEKCPQKANSIENGELIFDRTKCNACGLCAEPWICFAKARKLEGKDMTIAEVMKQVASDYTVYNNSGGGLTISGGDCEAQPEFTIALLKAAHDELINTAVEITGAFPWETVKSITDHSDYILYDLKCMDDAKHIEGTKISNKKILENAKKLVAEGKNMQFRTPLIPGYNDSKENIEATARFIRDELGLTPSKHLTLLPYNSLGEEKYKTMGYEGDRPEHKVQSEEYIAELNAIIASS